GPDGVRKEFQALYGAAVAEGVLPPIDADLRSALVGERGEDDAWDKVMHETAARLRVQRRPAAVVTLAWQCWQLGDQPMASRLLDLALESNADSEERLAVTLAAVEFLWQTHQLPQADQLLEVLRQDAQFNERA